MMDDLPEEVAEHPLLQESAWVELRDQGVEPLNDPVLVTTEQSRAELLIGAWLLGLLDTMQPQMLRLSDMLTAGMLMNAVIMPRRSSKTTTLLCILLGRCYLRPVHLAGFTLLTTQKKTAERYRVEVYGPIVRKWPDSREREAFRRGSPVKLVKSNGSERVEFPNGSILAVLSPDGDAIRSGGYDTMLLDEAGEASAIMWEDIIGAVLPTFDTRPDGQLILAGTAGEYRGGSLFWDTLNDEDAGVIRYAIPDDTDPDELEGWESTEEHPYGRVREWIERMHPGLYGLTTLDRIAHNFKRLGARKFAREYLNLFGEEGSNTTLISAPAWRASARTSAELATVELPPVMAIAIAVHPDGRWASIAAAWWGEREGDRHAALLHHQAGVDGLANVILATYRKHNRRIVYDDRRSTEAIEIAPLIAARPPIQARNLGTRDVGRATVLTLKLLKEGNLWHYAQGELDDAVAIAVKRKLGETGSFGFGRPDERNRPDDDITPIEAVSRALYALDDEIGMGSLSGVFGGA